LTKSRNGMTFYFFDVVFEFKGFFFEGKRWKRCSKLSIAVEGLFPLCCQGRQYFL
jgi:hypothetical protein